MIFFEKTSNPPACLAKEKTKANGDHKCGDVLKRLKDEFKNKCYICEYKEPHTINVEHLRPHKGDIEKKFDWSNLFWSCGHCNNIKLGNFINIINCTIKTERVEERISLKMDPFPMEKVIVTAIENDLATLETVELLDRVYNGTTQLKTIEAANLRNSILNEIKDFQDQLCSFYKTENDDNDSEYFKIKIKNHLSDSTNFTAFKRQIIRKNPRLKADFEQFFT